MSASAATQKARATRRNQLDVPYGDGEGERMDIYFPDEDSEGEKSRWSPVRPPGFRLTSAPYLRYSFPALPVHSRRILAEWKVSGGN